MNNEEMILSSAAPWPNKEEFGHTYVEYSRAYQPESCDDTLKFNSGAVARLEEKILWAKQQLNVFARKAEDRKSEEALDAQLRQNELDDIAKLEKSLAAYNAVRPESAPIPLSKARRELMEAVKDASETVSHDTTGKRVIVFNMEILDVCQYDRAEIGNFTTGDLSLLYCQRLFGTNFGKCVADVVNHCRRMNGRPVSSVRNGELR